MADKIIDPAPVIKRLANRCLAVKGMECTILGEVIDMLRAEPAVMEWIPVTERLPESDVVVLVCGSRGGVYTAYMHCPGYWHKLNSKSHYCNPTHWMPLPEPPKE